MDKKNEEVEDKEKDHVDDASTSKEEKNQADVLEKEDSDSCDLDSISDKEKTDEKDKSEDTDKNKPVSERTQVIVGGLILLSIISFSYYRSTHHNQYNASVATHSQVSDSEQSLLSEVGDAVKSFMFRPFNVYTYEPLRFKARQDYTLFDSQKPTGEEPGYKYYYCPDSNITVTIQYDPNSNKDIYTTMEYTTKEGIKEKYAKASIKNVEVVHKDDKLVYFKGTETDNETCKHYKIIVYDLVRKQRFYVDILYMLQDDLTSNYYYQKLTKDFKYDTTRLR